MLQHRCLRHHRPDGGIYSQDYGDFIGNHAVLIVGYDEGEDCWIGKNSWGPNWVEGGWFRVEHGERGIGSAFPFYSAAIVLSPVPTSPVAPDIASPINGTLYVTMTRAGERDAILLVSNREIGPLTLGETLIAGEFKRGDTIQFDLVGIARENICFPSGWRIWAVRMDGGKHEFLVLERDKR